ncbi:MAG: immunoglobulin domain-containing protein [Flavobacterium sp.]
MVSINNAKNYIYLFVIFFGAIFSCSAQDSIFFISFGTGATPDSRSPLNPADGTTSLTYAPTGSTNAGLYTLLPNPRTFNTGAYHSGEDHTPGDVNGNMMILDVHEQGVVIYSKKIDGLCTNTKYEFSVWIAGLQKNLNISSRATFNIRNAKNNALIATTSSKQIPTSPTFTWERVSIIFTIPDASVNSLTLEIVSGMQDVNHTAYDDILFEALKPEFQISNLNPLVCKGADVPLSCTVESNFYTNTPVYQWQKRNTSANLWENIAGATNNSYIAKNVTETTEFRMLASEPGNIENTKCRSSSAINTVSIYPELTAIVTGSTAICQDETGPEIIFTGAGGKAPYSFTYTLNGIVKTVNALNNSDTAKVIFPTDKSGRFVFKLISVKDANSCEQNFTETQE